MPYRPTPMTALAMLALIAVPAAAQMPTSNKGSTALTKMVTGHDFAMKAAASDLFEIDSSKLALQKTKRADIREYADMMVRDHGAATTKLMTAAKGASPAIMVKPTLDTAQRAEMERLRKLPAGPAFDNAYIKAQVDAHQRLHTMLRDYAGHGSVPSLKAHAAGMETAVAQHLERAKKLSLGK